MSASKHTPGPWYVGAMNDCLFIIDQAPRPSNDDVNPDREVTVVAKLDYIGSEANARLIAAAPDLLEALKLFVRAEKMARDGNPPQGADELIGLGEAAIAKATSPSTPDMEEVSHG